MKKPKIPLKETIKTHFPNVFYLLKGAYYRFVPEKMIIRRQFKKAFGYYPDLKNPKAFNEKLQWEKLYDRNPLYTTCSDKYAVREYVKEKIGEEYLIPLLFVTEHPERIPFHKLPVPYIIKPNHASGRTIIVTDSSQIDESQFIAFCNEWLKVNYYRQRKEWQYKNIKPKIIVERLLQDKKGEIPNDYKFHCFNGKVEFIQVDSSRFGKHKKGFFDSGWNPLPFKYHSKTTLEQIEWVKEAQKPKKLKGLIKISELLSKGFTYVRVDLYIIVDQIYFGELTFTPGSGYSVFRPEKYDQLYGKKMRINYGN